MDKHGRDAYSASGLDVHILIEIKLANFMSSDNNVVDYVFFLERLLGLILVKILKL
jgi:hypothetical protein